MKRHYYSNTIDKFLNDSSNEILGVLSQNNEFDLEQTQRFAWTQEIDIFRIFVIPRNENPNNNQIIIDKLNGIEKLLKHK